MEAEGAWVEAARLVELVGVRGRGAAALGPCAAGDRGDLGRAVDPVVEEPLLLLPRRMAGEVVVRGCAIACVAVRTLAPG